MLTTGSGDGKNYDVNATMRMYKDSAIWLSANAVLGIEAMRVLITKDSVKLLNKLDKTILPAVSTTCRRLQNCRLT
jgi:hypothetical protein